MYASSANPYCSDYYDDTDVDGPIISNKSNDEKEYINEIIHLMADTHYTQLNSIRKLKW